MVYKDPTPREVLDDVIGKVHCTANSAGVVEPGAVVEAEKVCCSSH